MRPEFIAHVKEEISQKLQAYLSQEAIEFKIAANDNYSTTNLPLVTLKALEDIPLQPHSLINEIKVILAVLGKPWQCDALIMGIYQALQPHHLTLPELTVILMSLHVETVRHTRCYPSRTRSYKQATLRYIIEEMI